MKKSSKISQEHPSAGSRRNGWEFASGMPPEAEKTSFVPAESQRPMWPLETGRIFLNHGSYGACPQVVLDYQSELRALLERSPVNFMARRYPKLLSAAREQVALFLGARPNHLAFVSSTTAGVNAVLRSLEWEPGDEILLTDHGYNACHNVVRHLSQRHKVGIVTAAVPFPEITPETLVEAVLAQITPATKLAMLDHVSSPTGLVFPIAELATEFGRLGIPVLVDGAHAPGMLPLDLELLGQSGVTYYAGNLHKWCCSPKGTAVLWISEKDQAQIHPPVISHGFNSRNGRAKFLEEFDWCGTFDPTAWLAAPAALDFMQGLHPAGWPGLRGHCHDLLLRGRQALLSELPPQALVPSTMLGQIASLRLPTRDPVELYDRLYDDFGIDSWLTNWNDQTLLRISAAPYNQLTDYQALADALAALEKDSHATPTPHF